MVIGLRLAELPSVAASAFLLKSRITFGRRPKVVSGNRTVERRRQSECEQHGGCVERVEDPVVPQPVRVE